MFTFCGISVGRKDGRAGVRVESTTVTGGMTKNYDRNFHSPYPSTGPGITAKNMKKHILGTAQGLMLTALMLGTAGAMSEEALRETYLSGENDATTELVKLIRIVKEGDSRDDEFGRLVGMLKEKNKKKTWERVDTKSLISGARVFLKAKDSSYLGKLGQRTAKDALGTLLQETYNYMVTIMAIEEENKRLKRENEQILAEKEKAEEEREEFRAQNIASDARILELENKLLHKGGI